jgi:hypothetical protein
MIVSYGVIPGVGDKKSGTAEYKFRLFCLMAGEAFFIFPAAHHILEETHHE